MKQNIEIQLQELLKANRITYTHIETIPASGGDRRYFLIHTEAQQYIGTYGNNIRENEAFFYFTEIFGQIGAPVPKIIGISASQEIYIQTFGGNKDLLSTLLQQGYTPEMLGVYKKAIEYLAHLQIQAHALIDYTQCIASTRFDRYMVLRDLNYFKEHFADYHNIAYDYNLLNNEFNTIAEKTHNISPHYFMYRDFQGRNILLDDNLNISFIDYQGGMQGPLQYDVVSLLWQAKAQLPDAWKQELLLHYVATLKNKLHVALDEKSFYGDYNTLTLLRLLQVLGAYGLRGLKEKKQHFISSIYQGLLNLKSWYSKHALELQQYPTLEKIISQITENEFMQQYQQSQLTVRVNSFSYKQGIPTDDSGNGGGYVFDCRGILNPGRIETYKKQTGRDLPVKEFLENNTRMPEFLKNIQGIVDISVQDYIERGFENLMISFGCTGGQHRSVYAADAIANYIQEKYGVTTIVHHVEQEKKNWIN